MIPIAYTVITVFELPILKTITVFQLPTLKSCFLTHREKGCTECSVGIRFQPLPRPIDELNKQVIVRQATVQRCNATVNFSDKSFYPPTVNNEALHRHFFSIAELMLGAEKILERKSTMGAEDFSFFAETVPGYFYFVGMANDTQGGTVLPHSPFFELNEDVLHYGAALHASLTATYLLQLHEKSNAHET